jgi:predicted kinase
MDDPTLLILTGPPGAGKTTVGRLVASGYDPSACVESDWFYTTIINGFVPQWLEGSDPQNRAVIGSAMAMAARMSEAGYFTVIEGIFGPWYLDLVRERLKGHRVKAHYIVLRPDLQSCLERAKGRPPVGRTRRHPPLRDEEPIRMLWDLFSDIGEYERHVIDNSTLSSGDAARAVAAEVQHRRMML